MYTKEQLEELKDIIIKDQNDRSRDTALLFAVHTKTLNYILNMLLFNKKPHEIKNEMKKYSDILRPLQRKHIDPENETDYELAYEILFGDISIAPICLNDALAPIAKWRLSNGI